MGQMNEYTHFSDFGLSSISTIQYTRFFSNFTLVFVTTAVYLNQLVQKLPSLFHGTIL